MPQGDFQTFSSTVFGVGLLFVGGYFAFVGWWAPRLVLIVKTRDWLARADQPAATAAGADRPVRWDPTTYLAAAPLAPGLESAVAALIERLRGVAGAYPDQAGAIRELIALLEGWLAEGIQEGDLETLISLVGQILGFALGVTAFGRVWEWLTQVQPWVFIFTLLMTFVLTVQAAYLTGKSNSRFTELDRELTRVRAAELARLRPGSAPAVPPVRPRRWTEAATLVGASSLWSESFLVFVQFAGLVVLLSGAAALTVDLALRGAPAVATRSGSAPAGAAHAAATAVAGWAPRRGRAFSTVVRGVDAHLARVVPRLAPARPAPAGVLARLRDAAGPAE